MPPSSAGRRGSRSPTSAIPTASSPTSWPPRSRRPRAAGRRPSRTCDDLRRQVGGHRLDRRAEPLARARRDLGHAGRQARLRREAGQPQRRRGAADRAGGATRPAGSARRGRRIAPTPPWPRRPSTSAREARRRDVRAEHRLRPTREHRAPRHVQDPRAGGLQPLHGAGRRRPAHAARTSTTTGTGSGTPATASWATTTSTIVDICRWLMGLNGLGDSVLSVGGRLGYEDAGETPNTQVVVHTFGPATIVQEVRGLKTDPFSPKFKAGAHLPRHRGLHRRVVPVRPGREARPHVRGRARGPLRQLHQGGPESVGGATSTPTSARATSRRALPRRQHLVPPGTARTASEDIARRLEDSKLDAEAGRTFERMTQASPRQRRRPGAEQADASARSCASIPSGKRSRAIRTPTPC